MAYLSVKKIERQNLNTLVPLVEPRDQSSCHFDSTASTAVPTAGEWNEFDYVRNGTPQHYGAPGAKYVITGYHRITNGSSNVLNTDWLQARELTGA